MNRPEEQLQRAVAQLLALYEQRGLLAYAHVPNGGYRTPAESGILRALGVRRGVPDILVWSELGNHFGIELKAPNGKLSPGQLSWIAFVTGLGHRVYVCRSLDEVEAALRAEDVPAIGTVVNKETA
jgi:hypothetical protein